MDSSPQLAYLLAKMADDQPEKLPTPASCTAGMKLTTNHIQKKKIGSKRDYIFFGAYIHLTREWDWLIWGLLHTGKKRLLSYSIVSNTCTLPTLLTLPIRPFSSFWLDGKKEETKNN